MRWVAMLDRLTCRQGGFGLCSACAASKLASDWSRRDCARKGRRSVLSGLNHRDDHAGRIEAAPDSGLTDLDTALPRIINAHRDWGRERAATIP